MPYIINKTSGEPLLTLNDGIIDTSTSLGLVGKNYVGYGETQNENFIHLMENFSNNNPPSRPVQGQNWYDTENKLLKIYNGQAWVVVGAADISETEPQDATVGAIWLKESSKVLFVYDGDEWKVIGPEFAEGFGITRARSLILLDTQGNQNPVILLTVDDTVVSIVAQREFFISSQNPIENFSKVSPGINLSSVTKLHGNVEGVSDSAQRLETVRLINGVGFNGESNITIKSATDKQLKRGTYLAGADFDGSVEAVWSVDATASNVIGKVVARDSSGSFSAGNITANLIGNVTGNVTANSGTSSFDVVTATQFVGANLSGNARTATTLQNSRQINGVPFNGSVDITVPAAAQTLTGNAINPAVTLSNLSQVGTLLSLSVADAGIAVGSGNQLRLLVENQIPTLANSAADLPLRISITDPQVPGSRVGVELISSSTSLSNGGDSTPSLIPTSQFNIGHSANSFNKIYASEFIGNLTGRSTVSTSADTALNLSGGTAGSISYQSNTGQTAFTAAGVPGQVLRSSGTGQPVWGTVSFTPLEIGQYLTGANYNGLASTVWSVDATPNNIVNATQLVATRRYRIATVGTTDFTTVGSPNNIIGTVFTATGPATGNGTANEGADKVVARDSVGNFAANTITSSLIGNVTGNVIGNVTGNVTGNATTATRLVTTRTINGVDFNGTSSITIFDATKAPVVSPVFTGVPQAPTPVVSDNSNRVATTAFVKNAVPVAPLWAGQTSAANVIATYANNSAFPIGTKVAFWETRFQTLFGGNGAATFSDLYRRVLQKVNNVNGWVDVGG